MSFITSKKLNNLNAGHLFPAKVAYCNQQLSIKSSASKHRTAASPRSPSLPLPLNIHSADSVTHLG